MKLASVLWTSFLIFVNADNDVFEEEDKKKSRGPRAHFPDDVPDAISEKFFSRAGVNADWIPGKIHKIHPDATSFEVGGETVLFDDLVPMDGLFADGAQGFFGDEPEKPEIFIHRSKKSPNVQVMLGANRKILRASNLLPDGNVIDLINIQGHWYGEINAATDVPPDMVGIDMGGAVPPESSRQLFSTPTLRRRTQVVSAGCAVIAKASVFFAVDSDFYNDVMNDCGFDACNDSSLTPKKKVEGAIQYVFAAVQKIYREQACIELTIAGYDIKTKNAGDPYRQMKIDADSQVCPTSSDNGLLGRLTSWLLEGSNDPAKQQGVERTMFHLLYADGGLPMTWTRGCAWFRGICGPYGVGVSELAYRDLYDSSLSSMVNLLAHELGHQFNSAHVDDAKDNIMYKSIIGSDVFRPETVDTFHKCVNGETCNNSCIKFAPSSSSPPPPPPAPTNKPTRAPTRRPTPAPTKKPTRAPTRRPTPAPTKKPTRAPTRRPTPAPTKKPTRAPTRRPTPAPTDKPTFAPVDTTSVPKVELVVVNAETNTEMKTLAEGESFTINKDETPFSIVAKPLTSTVSSVVFFDNNSKYRTESVEPYCMEGDGSGGTDFYPVMLAAGTHTVAAIPFASRGGSGASGPTAFATIIVQSSVPAPTPNPTKAPSPPTNTLWSFPDVKLVLYNAETDTPIQDMVPGGNYDVSGPLSVEAVPFSTSTVSSVVFNVDGSLFRTENLVPYTLGGDWSGDYLEVNLSPGLHTVEAVPYTQNNAGGTQGVGVSVTLNVLA